MAGIFAKIIRSEIPSYKIYENELVYSFLDINPIRSGHTLIVPKIEIDHFLDVPEPHYSAVFSAGKLLGKAIQEATGCLRIGATVLGWDVPHFHLHLIPMWSMADMDFRKAKKIPGDEMVKMQKKIITYLGAG